MPIVSTRPRRPRSPATPAAGSPSAWPAAGWRSWTPPPTTCPRPSPTATSPSRPPVASRAGEFGSVDVGGARGGREGRGAVVPGPAEPVVVLQRDAAVGVDPRDVGDVAHGAGRHRVGAAQVGVVATLVGVPLGEP